MSVLRHVVVASMSQTDVHIRELWLKVFKQHFKYVKHNHYYNVQICVDTYAKLNNKCAIACKTRNVMGQIAHIINGNTQKVVSLAGARYEMLNVSGAGDCFYDSLEVALAFHNEFTSSHIIKESIIQKMKESHEENSAWFQELYRAQVDVDKRTHRQPNFRTYIRRLERPRAWGSMLEVKICTEVLNIEIQTIVRGKNVFDDAAAQLHVLCNHHVLTQFAVQLCQVNASDFDATSGHNHYVCLRPLELQLL